MRVGQTRKRDANEREIIKALTKAGAVVLPVSGPGVPDLFVYFRKDWHALEVKTAKGKLTDAQLETQAIAPFHVVTTVGEALKAIGL